MAQKCQNGNYWVTIRDIPYSSPRLCPDCDAEDFEWAKEADETEGSGFYGF